MVTILKSIKIFFKGFKIGKVKDVKLNDENRVDVGLYIYNEYVERIKVDSVFSKVSNPITGGKIILIQNELQIHGRRQLL